MQLVFRIAIYTSNGVVLMVSSWIDVPLVVQFGPYIYIVLMCNQLVVAYCTGVLVQSIGVPYGAEMVVACWIAIQLVVLHV